jgi:hypothetical protein
LVTALFLWTDAVASRPGTSDTPLSALATCAYGGTAFPLGTGATGAIGEGFIDDAVAIVVQAITQGFGPDFHHPFEGAFPAAVLAERLARVAFSEAVAIRHIRWCCQLLIDLTITVIVQLVTLEFRFTVGVGVNADPSTVAAQGLNL